jgi:hypothetical protein
MISPIFFASLPIVNEALPIVFKIERSFASPKLVVFGARSPLASLLIVNSGLIPDIH